MSATQIYRTLLPTLTTALHSFQSSSSKFRIVHTLRSSSATPKSLLILDSSFNPPNLAHLLLTTSALSSFPTPAPRLLLLFSTHNADKAPSAASFPQRLALMAVFATDLIQRLSHPPQVDIGLTTLPYYTDKSAAIVADGYCPGAKHTHLMGFDTLTRFLAPKYYPKFDPPLSALEPYFEAGHGLRVTIRPSEEWGTVEEQRGFVEGLGKGEMERDGGRREWMERIEMVEQVEEEDVSSTRARRAAKSGRWEEVARVCTERVAEVLREEGIYADDDRGAKMA
ncbi:Nucleotidylyl transferase [Myriangium duriaei CBS 260.36]|uniref:Nucleotidylyl transferase n=1 Tax=Myriangium duriaei CBS 260.36 TaxID=1168546 RepID=A0A9P4MLB9_9PEZI|nr:Nucleotidylyl transferase [Myriangium duriaei CBS 260.36]